MNRRVFVGAGITALAAGRRRSYAANDHVQVAVVGVGGRGRSLAAGVMSTPGAKLAAICDVDVSSLQRANAGIQKAGAQPVRTVGDMRTLFEDKTVDAIVIATPDHWHASATLLALAAGKDVYVEKPPSHNVREGRLMVEAARRHGRIVQVGTQSRSRPSTLRAIEFLRGGSIGEVLCAKAWNVQLRDQIGHVEDGPVPGGVDYDAWVGPAPWIPFNANRFHYKWHWHWHFGTGDAGNDGAHQIDIARWALGESYPERVSGMGRKLFFDDDQQTPDTMNVTFDYPEKSLIWEMRIWNPYMQEGVNNGVAVYGTNGMVHIGRWNRVWGFKVFDPKGKELRFEHGNEDGQSHMENFIASVRSRKMPNAEVGEGHLTAVHCHLANIVARVGRNLQFDSGSEGILNDPEAHALIRRSYRDHWATPKDA